MDTKHVEAAAKEVQQKLVKKLSQVEVQAVKEIAKVKKATESAVKQAEQFVKKNPEKAALVAAGIGAALGAAVAMLFSDTKKSGKKK